MKDIWSEPEKYIRTPCDVALHLIQTITSIYASHFSQNKRKPYNQILEEIKKDQEYAKFTTATSELQQVQQR